MMFVLALVLAVPLGLLLLVRRFGFGGANSMRGVGRLQVVSRVGLDPKHSIVLVRRDSKEQLILLSPTGPMILEDEVRLSRADRARMATLDREQEERRAALRQQVLHTRSRLQERLGRVAALAGRVRPARAPDFAVLVDEAALRPAGKAPTAGARPRSRKRASA